jgi:hypothetical protein
LRKEEWVSNGGGEWIVDWWGSAGWWSIAIGTIGDVEMKMEEERVFSVFSCPPMCVCVCMYNIGFCMYDTSVYVLLSSVFWHANII